MGGTMRPSAGPNVIGYDYELYEDEWNADCSAPV